MRRIVDFFAPSSDLEWNGALHAKLHIIWLGGALRDLHVKRIKVWKEINPACQINLWVDSVYKDKIKEQISDSSIVIHDISSVKLSKNLSNWIKALVRIEERGDCIPNYAAMSDIFRFKILDDDGGWYVDTDIEPFCIDKVSVHEQLQFHVQAERTQDYETLLSPSVIASMPHSMLTQQALTFLELLSFECNNLNYNKMMSSRDAFTRMMATYYITGFALRAALGKILVNDLPILEVRNSKDRFINNTALFDLLSSNQPANLEQSWILAESQTSGIYPPISGITLDQRYKDCMTGNKVLPEPFMDDIVVTRLRAYNRLGDVKVLLNSESKQKVTPR